jgi:hypothetical protein
MLFRPSSESVSTSALVFLFDLVGVSDFQCVRVLGLDGAHGAVPACSQEIDNFSVNVVWELHVTRTTLALGDTLLVFFLPACQR